MADGRKKLLRKEVAQRLRALPAREMLLQSQAVVAKLLAHEWYAASRCVCCYISMAGKEADTHPLIAAVLASGRKCLVPRVFGTASAEMAMLPVGSMAELESFPKNQWGTKTRLIIVTVPRCRVRGALLSVAMVPCCQGYPNPP